MFVCLVCLVGNIVLRSRRRGSVAFQRTLSAESYRSSVALWVNSGSHAIARERAPAVWMYLPRREIIAADCFVRAACTPQPSRQCRSGSGGDRTRPQWNLMTRDFNFGAVTKSDDLRDTDDSKNSGCRASPKSI